MRFLRPDLAHWGSCAAAGRVLGDPPACAPCVSSARRDRAPLCPPVPAILDRRVISPCWSWRVLAGSALVFALVRPQALLSRQAPEYQAPGSRRAPRSLGVDERARHPAVAVLAARRSRSGTSCGRSLKASIGSRWWASPTRPLVLSYLTRDVDSVLFYFDWIEADPHAAVRHQHRRRVEERDDVAHKDDRPTRKLFLIVSDGEDYGSELKRALEMVARRGFA